MKKGGKKTLSDTATKLQQPMNQWEAFRNLVFLCIEYSFQVIEYKARRNLQITLCLTFLFYALFCLTRGQQRKKMDNSLNRTS